VRQEADWAFSNMVAVGLCKQTPVVQFIRPSFALFMMLLPMLFTAFIAAIFHEIAAITFLQFYFIHSCDAAVSTHIGRFLYFAAHYY
jgi:hypothetical protein